MTTDTKIQTPELVDHPHEAAPLATRPQLDREPPRQTSHAPQREVEGGLSSVLAYRHSPTFGRLAVALSQAQGEFQEIDKHLTATVTSRREGARSYTYHYSDLATVLSAVRPALSKYGLATMQFPTVRRNGVLVTTVLVHGESGEWVEGDLGVSMDGTDPQAVGSATTYARRYGLTAMLSIAAGESDDDGQAASPKPKAPAQAEPAGYQQWLDDMRACADEGTAKLEAAWVASNKAFRAQLANTAPAAWTAIKAKAATADQKASEEKRGGKS